MVLPFPVPGILEETQKDQTVYINAKIGRNIPVGEIIMFHTYHSEVKVFYKGKLLYSFGSFGSYPGFIKSPGNCWNTLTSPGISEGDLLKIEITPRYNYYDKYISQFYEGNMMSLFLMQVFKYLPQVFIALCSFVLGLLILFFCFLLKLTKYPTMPAINLGLVSVFRGFGCLLTLEFQN